MLHYNYNLLSTGWTFVCQFIENLKRSSEITLQATTKLQVAQHKNNQIYVPWDHDLQCDRRLIMSVLVGLHWKLLVSRYRNPYNGR